MHEASIPADATHLKRVRQRFPGPLGGQGGAVRLHPVPQDSPDTRRLVDFVPSSPEESVWSGGGEDQECSH